MVKTIGGKHDELRSNIENTFFMAREDGIYAALDEAMKIIDTYVKEREDAVRSAAITLYIKGKS
jgi:hypothetical protein